MHFDIANAIASQRLETPDWNPDPELVEQLEAAIRGETSFDEIVEGLITKYKVVDQ